MKVKSSHLKLFLSSTFFVSFSSSCYTLFFISTSKRRRKNLTKETCKREKRRRKCSTFPAPSPFSLLLCSLLHLTSTHSPTHIHSLTSTQWRQSFFCATRNTRTSFTQSWFFFPLSPFLSGSSLDNWYTQFTLPTFFFISQHLLETKPSSNIHLQLSLSLLDTKESTLRHLKQVVNPYTNIQFLSDCRWWRRILSPTKKQGKDKVEEILWKKYCESNINWPIL